MLPNVVGVRSGKEEALITDGGWTMEFIDKLLNHDGTLSEGGFHEDTTMSNVAVDDSAEGSIAGVFKSYTMRSGTC